MLDMICWDARFEKDYDANNENPFVVYLHELAEVSEEATIEKTESDFRRYTDYPDYTVCWSEALDFAGGDPWLAVAPLFGYVAVHEILRELRVPEYLQGAQWTPDGAQRRVERIRAIADGWKEEIDAATFFGRREWMEKIGVPQVMPKSHLRHAAGGDEGLAEKLFGTLRSGRLWGREMPHELWGEGT